MSCEITVRDCFGREVVLDHANWQNHLSVHPDVVPYHDLFALALQDPDIVVQARRDDQHHFYRQGIVDDRYPGRYLRLIVVEFDAIYKVTTWRIARKVDTRGAIIYERRGS